MDVHALSKKLKESWSSCMLDNSYGNTEFITSVASNFEKFEESVQVRLLSGLLVNLKQRKRPENLSAMKKLLIAASRCHEGTNWVGVTAGLVHKHIFETNDVDIDSVSVKTVEAAVKAIRDRLESQGISGAGTTGGAVEIEVAEGDYPAFFAPLEHKFHDVGKAQHVQNPHFRFTGSRPKFLKRKEIEVGQRRQEVAGRSQAPLVQSVGLMRTSSSLKPSSLPSSSSVSLGFQHKKRSTVKMEAVDDSQPMSFDKLGRQGMRMAKRHKKQERLEEARRKSASAGGVTKTPTPAAGAATVGPSAGSTSDPGTPPSPMAPGTPKTPPSPGTPRTPPSPGTPTTPGTPETPPSDA